MSFHFYFGIHKEINPWKEVRIGTITIEIEVAYPSQHCGRKNGGPDPRFSYRLRRLR